ncbi:MAG TPA: nitroreductase family protein [Acidimicrobiales bacterium]|nr:nitroreductase family protein [Acidimicrobiales bacterium]
MDLSEALRTTGSVREFTAQPVHDALLYEILDEARFAPSGGNRQAWRVIVVHDAVQRRAISAAYLEAWHDYVAHLLAGVIPFSPLASEEDRAAAKGQRSAALARSRPDGFAETLGEVPVMLVVCVDLGVLAATDRDLDRYHFAGGASIYPFVWNILLAARSRGLGGVMTTVATRNEPRLAEILDLPSNYAVASVVALGYPQRRHTKLTRKAVSEFTTLDTFGGATFSA